MKANFLKNDENIEKWLRDVFGLQPIPFFNKIKSHIPFNLMKVFLQSIKTRLESTIRTVELYLILIKAHYISPLDTEYRLNVSCKFTVCLVSREIEARCGMRVILCIYSKL